MHDVSGGVTGEHPAAAMKRGFVYRLPDKRCVASGGTPEGAQTDALVPGQVELGYTAPAEAGEELADFRDGTVALGWNGLLHARKTGAPFSLAVDAVRWACTLIGLGRNRGLSLGRILLLGIELDERVHQFMDAGGRIPCRCPIQFVLVGQLPCVPERCFQFFRHLGVELVVGLVVFLFQQFRDNRPHFVPSNGRDPVVEMQQIPEFETLIGPTRGDLVVIPCKIKGPIKGLLLEAILVENHPNALVGSTVAAGSLCAFDGMFHQTVCVHSGAHAFDLHLRFVVRKLGKVVAGTFLILTKDQNSANRADSRRLPSSVSSVIPWHGRRLPGSGRVEERLRRAQACIVARTWMSGARRWSRCPRA